MVRLVLGGTVGSWRRSNAILLFVPLFIVLLLFLIVIATVATICSIIIAASVHATNQISMWFQVRVRYESGEFADQ